MPDIGPDDVSVPSEVERARWSARDQLAARATGGLTLDEYAERIAALDAATSTLEIEDVLHGLPELGTSTSDSPSWLVGVLGGTKQRGRWRLNSRLGVIGVLGGTSLDLGAAEVAAAEPTITVVAFLGGAEILAPPGVPIRLSGFSLLGGKSDERMPQPALPGMPVIRVRVFTFLGGVKVAERKQRPSPPDTTPAPGRQG